MLKILSLFILVLSFISGHAQESSNDDLSLDEFSEGLETDQETIKAPEKEDLEATTVKDAPEDQEYEKIEVTGSHIKRIGMEGALPVQMIDRDMIEQSGYNSVSDVLRDITASSFGGMRESSGSNAAGVATVSLRGLGADKTLVLLNGKRLPRDAVTGSVDLNLIPLTAVKRIDILKDGASATYGSDALGGVVNLITHKDFNGSKIKYQESFVTQYDGGKTKQAEFITGSSTARSYSTTILSFRENEKTFSKDRPWSDDGVSTIGSPGSYIDDSGVWKPDTNNCDPNDIIDGGSGSQFCSFKYSDYSTEMPELRQLNLMTLFEYETDAGFTIFGRANATKKQVEWQYAPAPGLFSIPEATAGLLGIPGYTTGDVTVRYRAVELGNRVTEIDTYSLGFQAGVKGSITDTIDWDFTFDRNTVYKNDLGVSGYGLKNEIETLIEEGKFNPFDYSASRGSLDSATYQPWQLSRSENNSAELRLNGEIAETRNGAVGAAVGVTHTTEKFNTQVDDLSANGQVFGSAGSNGGGDRETHSAFIETITPLAKGMELQLAARYDEYSDFGNTTNPKIGWKWNITKSILVRASAGTGFKAPQLKDLYAAESDGYPTFIDHVACATETSGGGSTPSCNPQQWNVKSGGNDALKEEKSESYNIGFMYQPSKRNSIGFDVWKTKLNNVVGIDYEQLTKFEQAGGDLSKYDVTVVRDASGKIDYIDAPLLNLASLEISGVDLEAEFAITNSIGIEINHSHLFYLKKEGFPGTGYEDYLGTNGAPAWKNNITLSFSKNKSTVRLIAKTIASHEKSVVEKGDIPEYTEVDLNYSQGMWKGSTLTVGVQNLLGTDPPLDDSNQNNQLNEGLYNPRGQSVFVGFKQRI